MAQLMDMEREKKFKSCVEVKVTEFFTEIRGGYNFIRSFFFSPSTSIHFNIFLCYASTEFICNQPFAFEINIRNILGTWGKLAELKITDYFKWLKILINCYLAINIFQVSLFWLFMPAMRYNYTAECSL